jgi:hypothetical protein
MAAIMGPSSASLQAGRRAGQASRRQHAAHDQLPNWELTSISAATQGSSGSVGSPAQVWEVVSRQLRHGGQQPPLQLAGGGCRVILLQAQIHHMPALQRHKHLPVRAGPKALPR